VRRSKSAEGIRVGAHGIRRAEAVQVGVERRLVVERLHDRPAGIGDDHRLADAAPAMADTDAERGDRAERRRDDAVAQDLAPVELVRPDHVEIVAGAAADQRDSGPDDAVGTADDLVRVRQQALGEQQQRAVRRLAEVGHGLGHPLAGRSRSGRDVAGRGGRDREALTAEGDHDHA
jgi:hypothetical protein